MPGERTRETSDLPQQKLEIEGRLQEIRDLFKEDLHLHQGTQSFFTFSMFKAISPSCQAT
jgi:hypothetical protein